MAGGRGGLIAGRLSPRKTSELKWIPSPHESGGSNLPRRQAGGLHLQATKVDLTDHHWAILEPLLPPAKPGGRSRTTDLRQVINAILYVDRTGGQWRALPHDFPPWSTVWSYFRPWQSDRDLGAPPYDAAGTDACEAGAQADSQRREHSQPIGENESKRGRRGYDGGKQVQGRKRHVLVDTTGWLMHVLVHAADIQDHEGGKRLCAPLQGRFPRLKLIWVESAYKKGDFVEWVKAQFGS